MLDLSTTTLVCVDCVEAPRAEKVIDRCKQLATFGASKFLTSLPSEHPDRVVIPHLHTLVMYSVFVLTELHKYIDTPHLLIVQRDGWIINPDSWNPAWLDYDYMGPLVHQYDVVGAGGFSFRSLKMMKLVASRLPAWDGTEADANDIQLGLGCYEDGVFSMGQRKYLESKGCKYPSLQEAAQFAAGGNTNPEYYVERPFGFHSGDYYHKVNGVPGWKGDTGIVDRP